MITYDKPVKNLIAGLNATGHVTHTKHRKDMVTIHHNGGRLSHEGVLQVWRTRPASAHVNIDGMGTLAQFVEFNEYAWATGTTEGNRRSISIEMANSAVGGNWPVAEVTWHEASRFAGWLFVHVIGERPSHNNLVVHHEWKPTICAGPYIDSVLNRMVELANQSYDYFKSGGTTPPPPPSSGRKSVSQLADEVIAGKWGNGDVRKNRLRAAGYDPTAVQAEVNRRLGGGSSSEPPVGKGITQLVDEVLRGEWGNGSDRRQRLTAAGHNYDNVQAEVNRRLGGGAPSPEARKSVDQVAREVIAGHWGNGVTRRQRLEGAGYNYAAVQRRVNELL